MRKIRGQIINQSETLDEREKINKYIELMLRLVKTKMQRDAEIGFKDDLDDFRKDIKNMIDDNDIKIKNMLDNKAKQKNKIKELKAKIISLERDYVASSKL